MGALEEVGWATSRFDSAVHAAVRLASDTAHYGLVGSGRQDCRPPGSPTPQLSHRDRASLHHSTAQHSPPLLKILPRSLRAISRMVNSASGYLEDVSGTVCQR